MLVIEEAKLPPPTPVSAATTMNVVYEAPGCITYAAATETATASDAGASAGTVSQINSTIDDARSMAKQVMRRGSGPNVQLATNYDSYLRTLKDSVRGVQSEREAQKLLKQASQTRQYIVFLQKQSQ